MKLERVDCLHFTFPEFPPRAVKREVIFSLMEHKGGLYFLNESDEILDLVSTNSYGFMEEINVNSDTTVSYENVNVGESVKIEEYDGYYDLDFTFGFELFIKSKSLGKISIRPPMHKGGVISQPLLYKDGTTPRYVRIEKFKESNQCK